VCERGLVGDPSADSIIITPDVPTMFLARFKSPVAVCSRGRS
jgi:hypothetical protein